MNKQSSRPCSSEDCQQELRRRHDKHMPDSRRRRCLFFLPNSWMILTKRTGLHTTLRMDGMRNRSSYGSTQLCALCIAFSLATLNPLKREQVNRTTASGDKIHLLKIVTNVKKKKRKKMALGQVIAQITCTDHKMTTVHEFAINDRWVLWVKIKHNTW